MSPGKAILAAVAVVAVLCCMACKGSGPSAGEPVVVALYTFSGTEVFTGEDLRQGVTLARDVVNTVMDLPLPMAAAKGLARHGVPLKVIFADCKGDPALAARLVEEYAARGVSAFLGCYSSTITEVASRRAESLGIPFLNAASTSPLLTRRGFRWFFRTSPDDAMFASMLFDFLDAVSDGGKNMMSGGVALVYENGVWGTGVSREEMRQAGRRGYAISADVPYALDSLDVEAVAGRVRDARPSVVLQASYAADAVALVRAMGDAGGQCLGIMGMNAGFIDPRFLSELGPRAEHILSREVFALDQATIKPVLAKVNTLFRARFGRDMTGNSTRAMIGLLVLADALNRAETFGPEDVRRALAATNIPADQVPLPWDGVRFHSRTGQNVLGGGIVVQVQSGVYTTVWPPEMATADPVWPGWPSALRGDHGHP